MTETRKEERRRQLINCCRTIIDNANNIFPDYDFERMTTVSIEFEPDSIPTIEIKKNIVSDHMIEEMNETLKK